jgi:hypothetical protein
VKYVLADLYSPSLHSVHVFVTVYARKARVLSMLDIFLGILNHQSFRERLTVLGVFAPSNTNDAQTIEMQFHA